MLFLDPVQEKSVELVKLAELFYKHKIPLRLVVLFLAHLLLFFYGPILAFYNPYQKGILILPAN